MTEPKILFIDIETSPTFAAVWSLFKTNVGVDMIEDDFFIMSYSAKWLGDDVPLYADCRSTPEDDMNLLRQIHVLFDEADFVVAHNGDKFDIKKINSRLLMKGFKPPSPYRTIDTLKIAKKHFGFVSNKLQYLTDRLCKNKKQSHGKYPGYTLWSECLKGNMEAWDEMKEYNIMDVISLEELYLVMRPWYSTHPVISMYKESDEETQLCPKCGSSHVHRRGYTRTNGGIYQRFKCMSCGGWSRSRYSETGRAENMCRPSSQ